MAEAREWSLCFWARLVASKAPRKALSSSNQEDSAQKELGTDRQHHFPDLRTMVTLNSLSLRLQRARARRPEGSPRLTSQHNQWWSLMTQNSQPHKYGLNIVTAKITTQHSFSVIEWLVSACDRQSPARPHQPHCPNTEPRPMLLASVCSSVWGSLSRCPTIGVVCKRLLGSSKAMHCSPFQTKGMSPFANLVKGSGIFEKLATKRR